MELLKQAIKVCREEAVEIEIRIKCANANDDVYQIRDGVSTRATEVDQE